VLHQSGPTANSFRGLSVDIAAQIPSEGAGAGLVVGGVAAGDRSADVALNIAAAWAMTGRRVALIDADESSHPVRSSLRTVLEPPDQPTRINLGQGADVVLDGRYEGVDTGVLDVYSTDFVRLAQRHRFGTAMSELGASYDYVVVFTEPAFGSATAVRWAGAASGALLVVGSDVASARTVQQCAATLSRAANLFLGVVFDERRRRRRWLSFWRRLFGAGGSSRTTARRPAKKPARRHEPVGAEMSSTS
jgi:Mrp family chromosome partitioning ATPase